MLRQIFTKNIYVISMKLQLLHTVRQRKIYARYDVAEIGLTYRVAVTAWSGVAAINPCGQNGSCAEST